MNVAELTERCEKLIAESKMPSVKLLSDYFELLRLETDKDIRVDKSVKLSVKCGEISGKFAREHKSKTALEYYELRKKCLLLAAPDDLDSYLLYVEWNRQPEKKFYQPRRKVLKVVVDDLQDLEDDKLDFLAISLPPRVGKSTLGIFFVTWVMGRHPELANLMSGHSDKLTKGFYKEVLSIIKNTDDYLWHDVFDSHIVKVSAEDESIDLNKEKRFPSLTCRSISGTLTGAVEVGRLLYVDDIIEDLEEALNADRLQNKYDAYLNQLKDRKKDNAKELHIGTRWAVGDVIGRIKEQYEGNERYRFRVIPALNEDDKSNFNYPYGLGFSDRYYIDMRNSIDYATWCAKYLGEPYVREGLLFPRDELEYYNGTLPEVSPDRIVAVCDVAWGGGDDLVMVIAAIYGEEVYIVDFTVNNGDKGVTQPIVCGKLARFMPHQARFEANNGGDEYADKVGKMLKEQNKVVNITWRRAPNKTDKMSRIIQNAYEIKMFKFIDNKHANEEYRRAMNKLCGFVQNAKNEHDDVPDALSQLVDFIYKSGTVVKFVKRPF